MKRYTQIKNYNKLIGKTIHSITSTSGSGLVIIFSDDTFVYLSSTPDYEGYSEITLDDDYEYYSWDSVNAGMITEEELKEAVERKKIRRERVQEKYEKDQYERLKAKFEK